MNDVLYWLGKEPAFGKQAVYLDARVDTPAGYETAVAGMGELAAKGVKIVAPPMFALVKLDANNKIVPSEYAVAAKARRPRHHHLDPRALGLPRPPAAATTTSPSRRSSTTTATCSPCWTCWRARSKVRGIFSDWPATVTYYANCMGLK